MNTHHNEAALADALNRALDRRSSAGGATVLDHEVAGLVEVAQALECAAAEVVPSVEFRAAARQRLMTEMARSSRVAGPSRSSLRDRLRIWAFRLAAGLAALSCAGAAAASASASALPGDALYPVKQATETVELQLAPGQPARQEVLLRQANARLDEAARLLDQGRADDAAASVGRYDNILAMLPEASGSEHAESDMRTNEVRLNELLQTAPAPARAGLENALAATERNLGRARSRPADIAAEIVTPVAQPTSAPSPQRAEPVRPSDSDGRNGGEPPTNRAADADERASHESHGNSSAARGRDVERPTEATTIQVETERANAEPSGGHSEGAAISENRATRHANPQAPATTTRGSGTPPEGNSAPRQQGGGRGRP